MPAASATSSPVNAASAVLEHGHLPPGRRERGGVVVGGGLGLGLGLISSAIAKFDSTLPEQ